MPENTHNLILSPNSPARRGYSSLDRGLKQVLLTGAEGKEPLSTEQLRRALKHLDKFEKEVCQPGTRIEEQILKAQEIMGEEKFFGPEAVTKLFGFGVPEGEIPPIPFSNSELETANTLGHLLVLRWTPKKHVAKMTAGILKRIVDDRLAQLPGALELGQAKWDSADLSAPFFSSEVIVPRWALIQSDYHATKIGSSSHMMFSAFYEFIENIRIAGFNNFPEFKLDDSCTQFKNIWGSKKTDFPLDELVKLIPFQKFCPTFVEIYYDFFLTYMNNGYHPIFVDGVCSRSLIEIPGLVGNKPVCKLAAIIGKHDRNDSRYAMIADVNPSSFGSIADAFAFQQTEHYYD